MKRSRLALFQSLIALLLCFSMLVGTTFAWFTDSESSGTNTIAAGHLNVELEYLDAEGNWQTVNGSTEVLDKTALWEPGHTEVAYLRITNAGDLALKYALGVGIINENGSVNARGEKFFLSDHIRFGLIDSESQQTYASRTEAQNALTESKLIVDGVSAQKDLLEKGQMRYVTLVVYMPEDVGNIANYATGVTPPEIQLGIELVASQAVLESDTFGTDYDTSAALSSFSFPVNRIECSTSGGVETEGDNTTKDGLTLENGQTTAFIPEGVLLDEGVDVLTLEVSSLERSEANITLATNEASRSLDVHVAGVSQDNTVPMEIYIREAAAKGLNTGNLKLYHVEKGETVAMTRVEAGEAFTAHNQFKYDPATGDIALYLATFSEVALVADTTAAWAGEFDYSWYDNSKTVLTIANADQLAAFGQIVGGMAEGYDRDSFDGQTVNLVANVNLNDAEASNATDKIFHPIGYFYDGSDSTVQSFEGIFDGHGHTIANFYQNTWEIKGDYDGKYYKDAMGLFGYVLNGTVKNLTVSNFSSDGEFTPTGVIAAYVDGNSTFENIAITNCNPRVYNTGNGGIIGIAGDTSAANDDHITLKNITVDNSNKISALWGSYDVACGGLVGMYRGNVDGSGNATGDTISFTNCHVSAIMDVYNDVCGNYQYYAYRYAGMIIGSVRHNTTNADGKTIPNMAGISASGCTVNYGTWNDYYYCEFVKNGHPSYSGLDDYKFSRVPNNEIDTSNGKGNATCIGHNHTDVEDNQAIYLPFNQLFTGYGWGVNSVGLKEYSGIVTDLGITEGDQEESVVKFNSKFTGDFLYRVGNANTVSVGSLFAAAPKLDENGEQIIGTDGKPVYWDINSSGVVVTIDKVEKDANVSGVFNNENKDNNTNWTESTIKFSGTGVVKVTIQDYDFCTPTEVYLEVVDAWNTTTAISAPYSSNGVKYNVVLLNNVTNGSFSVGSGYGFYGNGFTITLNPDSHTTKRGAGFDGYIHMNGGTLDNVRIEGPTFAAANIYRVQGETGTGSDDPVNYFRNGVIIDSGDAKITNSYLSGARTALYVKDGGNVVIENTTVSGGAYANIEVSVADSVTLRNVTTIQRETKDSYGQNKDMIGLAIVIDNSDTKLVLDGVTQYNWMTQAQWEGMLGSYKDQFPKLFTEDTYSNLWHVNDDGTRIVNTGIIWACAVDDLNMEGSIGGYTTANISLGGNDGKVYTAENGNNANATPDTGTDVPGYNSNNQTAIPPVATFDYTSKNYQQYVDGEDAYCYYDAGVVKIGFTKGGSKDWDPMILSIKKDDKTITDYTVTLNDKDYTGKTITFAEAGNYKVIYTYTDPYNYKYDADNKLVSYSVPYEHIVNITVNVTEETAKNAEFKMGAAGNSVEKIPIGDKTYLSATGVDASALTASGTIKFPQSDGDASTISFKYNSDKTWGNATINGQTFYFPIVSMGTTDGKWSHTGSWYGCFPVFDGTFTIIDYADGGTGNEITYDSSTTAMPANLQALYPQTVFRYQGTQSKVPTTPSKITKGTYNGKLCYTTQTDLSASNERGEEWNLATYTYTDNKGATYYWYVGYYCAASTNGSCVTSDTLVTLADGTQKRIDELSFTDKILVWDFFTGTYAEKDIVILVNHGEGTYNVTNLEFSDGTVLRLIGDHGVFDYDLNRFVYITADNMMDYVGHRFVKYDTYGSYDIVTLDKAYETVELTSAYSITSAGTSNAFASNLLTVAPPEDFYNWIEMDGKLHYDVEQFQNDVKTYGLYTYDDFKDYVTYEQFVDWNGAYLKIAVEKGYFTFDYILELIELYKGWMPNY